jgi:UPF0271 protein
MGRDIETAINCDMGESFGLYQMADDAAIMPHITTANVACGFHASDPVVMHRTVKLAKQHGVKVGAHPSLPDLQGFGRREMKLRRDELRDIVIYQVGALKGFLEAEGMLLNHIKPHGALYGMATRDEEVAQAICDAADVFKVPLYGMAGTMQERIYTARGHPFVGEFYADLDYDGDGRLIITREHTAVEPDVAVERCRRAIIEGVVRSVKGNDIPTTSDSICVHSDTPGAVAVARAVRALVDGLSSGRG